MNIAFVLSYLDASFGGPVSVARGFGQYLTTMDHRVSYWAPGTLKPEVALSNMGAAHVYGFNWPHRWHRSKGLVQGLVDGCSEIDLVHISGFWLHPTYAGARVARKKGIPYVLCPSGTLEPWSLRRRKLKWLKKAIYLKAVAASTMDSAVCLHACSPKEAESFRTLGYGGPITIIPNGINMEEYAVGDAHEAEFHWPCLEDRPVVVFMSRLSPEKGLDLLIPAWADIVRSRPHREAILVIAGPDDRGYRRVVEAMLKRYRLSSRVLLPGMVQGRQKTSLLRRADIFVLPSYSENFGIVVAEALACGTPVITTMSTPWEQLPIVDAGRWVPPTKQDIGLALQELLGMSESQRKKMGKQGAALVSDNYSWDKVAGKFVTVCDCILHGRPIPLHPQLPEVEEAAV